MGIGACLHVQPWRPLLRGGAHDPRRCASIPESNRRWSAPVDRRCRTPDRPMMGTGTDFAASDGPPVASPRTSMADWIRGCPAGSPRLWPCSPPTLRHSPIPSGGGTTSPSRLGDGRRSYCPRRTHHRRSGRDLAPSPVRIPGWRHRRRHALWDLELVGSEVTSSVLPAGNCRENAESHP